MSVSRDAASFGWLLREHRLAAGLTQEALAERSGVSPRTIQQLEAGIARPRRATALYLAEALALTGPAHEALLQAATPAPRRRAAASPERDPVRRGERGDLAMVPPRPADADRDRRPLPFPRQAPATAPVQLLPSPDGRPASLPVGTTPLIGREELGASI